MAPLQREVYRSILSKPDHLSPQVFFKMYFIGNNLDILRSLTQPSAKQNTPAKRINNVLMQLRK
jgi:hypothetical protein